MTYTRIVGVFLVLSNAAVLPAVVINEIHYHPAEGARLEYVEVYNPNLDVVHIEGWTFTSGISFVFPPGSAIAAGGFVLVCRDRESVLVQFDIAPDLVHGNYGGGLDNGGERLVLEDGTGEVIEEMRYDDDAPWDERGDGDGPTLQRICFSFPGSHPANWAAASPTPLAVNATDQCPPPQFPVPPIAINEIHYHPLNDTDVTGEFVELRNNGDAPADLVGYSFSTGIDFVFDGSTVVEAGGLVAVCRDADFVRAEFGIDNAVGNFQGQLANDGERLTLVDPDGNFVDSVRYGDDGDWPVVADGLGRSLEKMVPTSLTDDPASWTAAGILTVDIWNTITVTGRATSSRFLVYIDAAGEALVDNIVLEQVDDPGVNLIANGTFDEGLDPWELKGNHGGSVHDPDAEQDGGGALRVISTGRGTGSSNGVVFNLEPTLDVMLEYRMSFDYLHVSGSRGLTVRLLGSTATRGVRWKFGSGTVQTPGVVNTVTVDTDGRPPFISGLVRSPREPLSTDSVWITARVRADSPVASVSLEYGVDSETPADTLAMYDDGGHGDGLAGDGVYGMKIPPQAHDSMVIFVIKATDDAGRSRTSPYPFDPTGFHGYYVNDEQRPDSPLPLYTIIIKSSLDVAPRLLLARMSCDIYRPCSFAHRGDLYYNAEIRRRGQSVCGSTKPFMKVRFRRGRDFQNQHKINLQSLWTDKSLIREKLSWDMFHDVGSPSCRDGFVRVHANGEYYGLHADVEHPDSRFLDRNNLDRNGNLYKAVASREERFGSRGSVESSYEKKTNEDGDFSDLKEFLASMHDTVPAGLVQFFSERVDEDRVIDYQLAQTLTNNSDYPHKNHYMYHDLDRELWMPITWDVDLTYGKIWNGSNSGVYHDLMHNPGTTPWYAATGGNVFLTKFFTGGGSWYRRAYLVRVWDALQEKYTREFFDDRIEFFRDLLLEEQAEDIAAWGRTPPSADDPEAPPEFDPNLERVREHVRIRREFLLGWFGANHPDIMEHDRIKITEVFYNPPGPNEELEFLELWNGSGREVDLAGWSVEGFGFDFGEASVVQSDEIFVVAKNPAAFIALHGEDIRVFGPCHGNLDNNGEILRLKDSGPDYPATVDFLRYSNNTGVDGAAWPALANGIGHSIELTDVSLDRDNDLATAWRASSSPGGSPGRIAGINVVTEPFRRGDINADGTVNISDPVYLLLHLFLGLEAPGCLESADANADSRVNIADVIYFLNALFTRGGPMIPSPGTAECWPSSLEMCAVSNCVVSQ